MIILGLVLRRDCSLALSGRERKYKKNLDRRQHILQIIFVWLLCHQLGQRSLYSLSMKFEWTRTFKDTHCDWTADTSHPEERKGARNKLIRCSTFSLPKLRRASISVGQASWLKTVRSVIQYEQQQFSQWEMWAEAMTQTCVWVLGGTTELLDRCLFELHCYNGCWKHLDQHWTV